MEKKSILCHIDIPSYSFKQEKFNSISHFLGIPIGLTILITSFILFFSKLLPFIYFIGLDIFGVSTILLYFISGYYHVQNPKDEVAKKILRIIDHCTIYVLIAGTYTPICLYLMSKSYVGVIMLAIQWVLAIVGIVINAIDLTNIYVKTISMILYLVMGWLIIFTGAHLLIPETPFILILTGGLSYTLGSVLYGIGHKKLTFHSVFHIFVLIGTLIQAIGVIYLFL